MLRRVRQGDIERGEDFAVQRPRGVRNCAIVDTPRVSPPLDVLCRGVAAGGDWPERARRAAVALHGQRRAERSGLNVGSQLLCDLRDLFERHAADKIPSARIVEELALLEHQPWPEWNRGRPITAPQLARLLKPYGIEPKQDRVGDRNLRTYRWVDLAQAVERYAARDAVPSALGATDATPLQPNASTATKALTQGGNSNPKAVDWMSDRACSSVASVAPDTEWYGQTSEPEQGELL